MKSNAPTMKPCFSPVKAASDLDLLLFFRNLHLEKSGQLFAMSYDDSPRFYKLSGNQTGQVGGLISLIGK